MAKILVTGADGFIGSHLVEELVQRGHQVKAFVYYNSFDSKGWLDHIDKKIFNEIEFFAGDVRDPFGVSQAVKGCDVVYHLAALIAIPYSYHSPATYVETNINGTLNIMQACRTHNIERVLQTSTSEVYGTAIKVPISEEHPLQGQSPYSASKIGADQMAFSFYSSFDTPVSVVRPFNTYGPRQSLRAVIPTIICQLAKGNRTLKLGSIHPTRDFNYIKDTVSGFIAIANSQESVGKVINIGSNYEISIGETAKTIAKVMGVEIEIEQEDERLRPEKSEVERLWADNSLAKEICHWEPHYSGIEGFERGIKETSEWFQDNLDSYKSDKYVI